MKQLPRLILSLVALLTLGTPGVSEDRASAKLDRAELEARVDAYLKPYVEGGNFSGAVLIARHGEVVVSKGYGMANYELGVPNTPHTRFQIASVSKPFTAAAILLLEERGRLSTKDPVSRFLPDYPRGDEITLEHLLTHTSGIPNLNDFPEYEEKSRFPHTPQEVVELFRRKPLEFSPGEHYRYSNSNYALLAYILEKASGQSYGEFLQENILAPLGMKSTGHAGRAAALVPNRASGYAPAGLDGVENAPALDWSIKTGNGSLYSTLEDLYRLDRALRTDKLLKPSTRERIFRENQGNSYGWFVRHRLGRRVAAANGRSPGFTASWEMLLDEDVSVIVLSNLYSTVTQTPIAADLAALALGEAYEIPEHLRPVPLAPSHLDAYAGRYEFGPDFFRPGVVVGIRRQDGYLELDWGGGFQSLLVPVSETEFRDRNFWARVTFPRNEEGKVVQMIWQLEQNFAAERLAEPEREPASLP